MPLVAILWPGDARRHRLLYGSDLDKRIGSPVIGSPRAVCIFNAPSYENSCRASSREELQLSTRH